MALKTSLPVSKDFLPDHRLDGQKMSAVGSWKVSETA